MGDETSLGSNAACLQHPEAAAQFVCARCQTAVCAECCYTLPNGSVCCKACYHNTKAATPSVTAPPPVSSLKLAVSEPVTRETPRTTPPPGGGCIQHPHVMPVARCNVCGAASCSTCDFVFPPNLHFCPVCVVSATGVISPRRKKYLIAAYVLAACSSLGFIGFIGGAAAGLTEGGAEVALGILLLLFVGVPSIVGTAMGMSAKRPGGPNPISVWIAFIWNALILGGFGLMIIIGNFME
jgi:hypothetical protein